MLDKFAAADLGQAVTGKTRSSPRPPHIEEDEDT